MKTYADWKAPKTDEAHLLWPAAGELLEQTRTNTEQLDSLDSILIQNMPLTDLRRATRSAIGLDLRPVIGTGHQIEMYHPGVWVKNIVIDEVAKQVGGRAIHVAVDTDTPKHLQLKWPDHSHLMSDDPQIIEGAWSSLVAAPSPGHLDRIERVFDHDAKDWAFKPAIHPFFAGFRASQADTLGESILTGAKALDETLGLDVSFVTASRLIATDGYLAFLHHVASDIERFAKHYNAALAAYRKEAGITTDSRPMPDLKVTDAMIELPFWLDDLDLQQRTRAVVVKIDGGWALAGAADDPFVFDPDLDAPEAIGALRGYLKEHRLRLSPRALTLTMFMRLLLVDQFIHGIGGARYDQVTDRIIHTYFAVDPPAFSVATATLYFPGSGERLSACIPCLMSEGHHLRHNVLPTKQTYLETINRLPRKSLERRASYVEMHRALAKSAGATDTMPQWKNRLQSAIARQDAEKTLFDRELFYGIQPRERLTSMIERYRIAFQ